MIVDGIEHSVKPSFQPRYPQSPRISVGTWTCIELPGCNTAEKHRLQVCPPALDAKEAVPDRFTINPCGLSFQRVNPQSDSDATWTLEQHTLKSEHGMQVPALPACPRSESGVYRLSGPFCHLQTPLLAAR
jgi:hypothetical protein